MRIAIGFFTGLLFGFGLVLAGMTSPDKVLAFLDIAGAWDPSLAFVMGGAVMTATPLFALARRREKPLAGATFDAPLSTMIDRRLVAGSVLFGIGWGLAGICPGPALVDLAIMPSQTIAFIIPMVVGLMASATWRRKAALGGPAESCMSPS